MVFPADGSNCDIFLMPDLVGTICKVDSESLVSICIFRRHWPNFCSESGNPEDLQTENTHTAVGITFLVQ